MASPLSDVWVVLCDHGQPRGRSGDQLYICGICDAEVIIDRDRITCRHGNLHGKIGRETFVCSTCENGTSAKTRPVGPRQLTDLEVARLITNEIKALVGGPGSLRYWPHVLVDGLAEFTGKLLALTLRSVEGEMPALAKEYDAAPIFTLRFSAVQSGVDAEGFASTLANWLALPANYRRPSNLVLPATLSVFAQVGKAVGAPLDELSSLLKKAHAKVSQKQIDEFQKLAAAQRSN